MNIVHSIESHYNRLIDLHKATTIATTIVAVRKSNIITNYMRNCGSCDKPNNCFYLSQ